MLVVMLDLRFERRRQAWRVARQAVGLLDAHLFRRVLVLRVLALTQGQRNGRDDGHEQDHGRHLNRCQVVGEQLHTQCLGIGQLGSFGRERLGFRQVEAARQHEGHFHGNHRANGTGQREVLPEALPQRVDVDVEHHHHEQEEHHHGTHVHKHQRNRQELGLKEHPHARGTEEGQHEVQRGTHGALGGDHAEAREAQHEAEEVKE
jgi:hypothetical protein